MTKVGDSTEESGGEHGRNRQNRLLTAVNRVLGRLIRSAVGVQRNGCNSVNFISRVVKDSRAVQDRWSSLGTEIREDGFEPQKRAY